MANDFVQLDLFAWEAPASSSLEEGLKRVRDQFAPQPVMTEEEKQQQEEDSRRDGICKEWRGCDHKDTCFTNQNEEDGICFVDEPHRIPNRGPFSRCELKVLNAGFGLVRYDRDEKRIDLTTSAQMQRGWCSLDVFPTYAAAERKLKELIDQGCIQTDLQGKIVMSGWNKPGRLMEAGFEFYRVYGLHAYDSKSGPWCIKVGSKNWSNLAKYKDATDLRAAWLHLLKEDPMALEG